MQATVDGAEIAVGGPALVRELGVEAPSRLADVTRGWSDRGATVLTVIRDHTVIGALALEDRGPPAVPSRGRSLQRAGVRVIMITGDASSVADAVAGELGVDEVIAEVLPEDKDAAVARLGDPRALGGDGG